MKSAAGWTQTPPVLYIHLVSHNEPTDHYENIGNYLPARTHMLQMAGLVDSFQVKWNIQSSDGFVKSARNEEINTGTNIFEVLQSSPYADNIEVDPRSKNDTGYNIADQWYILDSIGAQPTHTVGGFIYTTCPPASSSSIDWWQYTDTITGVHYHNKIKFNILSGAGSLAPHCNDLNDFGIFKPDTITNFYHHNPGRNLWCIGTGCAPVLDTSASEQEIIDLIQAQVDSIQNGLWPQDKFYVTRIMTNQRDFGNTFFQKLTTILDSLTTIPSTQLKWATIEEIFTDFVAWQTTSLQDHSMWLCETPPLDIDQQSLNLSFSVYPNPSNGAVYLNAGSAEAPFQLEMINAGGQLVRSCLITTQETQLYTDDLPPGMYWIRIYNAHSMGVKKWIKIR